MSEFPRGWQSALARELGVSRQRVWQMLRDADGLCVLCGKPREQYRRYCDRHMAQRRDWQWGRYGSGITSLRYGPTGPHRRSAP